MGEVLGAGTLSIVEEAMADMLVIMLLL